MAVRLTFLILCASVCNAELVRKKLCKNVENTHCAIHNVDVDPCPDGPGLCLLRQGKPYSITIDYTPRFSADSLKVAIRTDDSKTESFDTEILSSPADCQLSNCSIEEDIRRQLNVNFSFEKHTHGKFPVLVKLWNAANQNQTCCFTFNVRMLKFRKSNALNVDSRPDRTK